MKAKKEKEETKTKIKLIKLDSYYAQSYLLSKFGYFLLMASLLYKEAKAS